MLLFDVFELFFNAMIRPGVLTNEIKKCDFHDEKKLQINDVILLLQYNSFLISLISL